MKYKTFILYFAVVMEVIFQSSKIQADAPVLFPRTIPPPSLRRPYLQRQSLFKPRRQQFSTLLHAVMMMMWLSTEKEPAHRGKIWHNFNLNI
jgi:hypothetical protein